MDLARADELLGKAVRTLATHPGEVRARLHEAREDLFEIDERLLALGEDDQFARDIRQRIFRVKQSLVSGGAMDLTEDEAVALAEDVVHCREALRIFRADQAPDR